MKILPLLVSLTCLAACRAPKQEPANWAAEPAPTSPGAALSETPAEIDFAPFAGRDMSVEEFVRTCQVQSGFNFTWGPDTDAALKSSSLRLAGEQRVAAAEFPQWLDARLASAGFSCKRVGPEHLNVFLVERRAG